MTRREWLDTAWVALPFVVALGVIATWQAMDVMARDRDFVVMKCQAIAAAADVSRCGLTRYQQRVADRERREAEDAARWEREARRILGAGQ